MENFKLEIFNKEHKGEKFLFQKVKDQELSNLIQELTRIVGNAEIKASIEFFNTIKLNFNRTLQMNKTNNLKEIFKQIGLKGSSLGDVSYLIWKFPNDIDRFDLKFLINNWNYIWYGDSDDAVVIYIENKILMLITHYGTVKFLEL